MDVKIFADIAEPEAVSQVYRLARLPAFQNSKIRMMPDMHAGVGCCIGFTADLGDKVIPNIVGADIGCGMRVVEIAQQIIDCEKLDSLIRALVSDARFGSKDDFHFESLICWPYLNGKEKIRRNRISLGGNHFIEVDRSEDGHCLLIVHTGSRDLGVQVAEYYQNLAISRRDGQNGVPKELSYLEGVGRFAYLHDMRICQDFASGNRKMITDAIVRAMGWDVIDQFETVHNYIDPEANIVRKGAVSARLGEKLIIPMNMRDGCIIAIGKGNEDWNCSAPHGAGRLMKRSKAKEVVDLEEYKKSMAGVWTSSVCRGTIDESPMAYKPMDAIVSQIRETVDIVEVVKPVYNFKASE